MREAHRRWDIVVGAAVVAGCLACIHFWRRENPPARSGKVSRRILVATRIHTSPKGELPAVERVVNFAVAVPPAVEAVLICVGVDGLSQATARSYVKQLEEALCDEPRATVQIVMPWGCYTHALNVAVQHASVKEFDLIHFMSLECTISQAALLELQSYIGDDVVCCGAALDGHLHRPAQLQPLGGRSCPWNTMAMWSVPKLALTGFPLIGDGNASIAGGVEEVTAIALLQYINPSFQAILLKSNQVMWNADSPTSTIERRSMHHSKMASKEARPRKQMEELGLPVGHVWHL